MRKLAGLERVIGFGSSMALLAIASLLIIPAMMKASGSVAWGAVALGQAVGGIASVMVGYGWNMAGPAQIAASDPTRTRQQFLDSVVVRLVLFVPIAALAMAFSMVFSHPGYRDLAAIGALSSTAMGLSSNWYFVGKIQPWILLVTETVPRVLGTVMGMVAMMLGHGAFIGVLGQLIGMLVAVGVSCAWIFRHLAALGAERRRAQPVRHVLWEQRDGVLAAVAGAAMGALPVVIVAWANPAAQPLYAFVDKLQRQMQVALTPFVTALQGWVPRGNRVGRGRRTVTAGLGLCLLLTGCIALFAPVLTHVLGAGILHTPLLLNLGMAAYVGLGTYELMLSHVVLAAFTRLKFVATITMITGTASLLLIAALSVRAGAQGAVLGVLLGLLARVVAEAAESWRAMKAAPRRALV